MEQSSRLVNFIITALRAAAILTIIFGLIWAANASGLSQETAPYYGGLSAMLLVGSLWPAALAALLLAWAAEILNSLQVMIEELRALRPKAAKCGGQREEDEHARAVAGLSGGNDADAHRQ